MTICNCYRAERNYAGDIGVCIGTKECDACGCGGDQSKCDFYQYLRDRAEQLEPPRRYTAEEVLDCIASVMSSIVECKICHKLIYPKVYIKDGGIHCDIDTNTINIRHLNIGPVCDDCLAESRGRRAKCNFYDDSFNELSKESET